MNKLTIQSYDRKAHVLAERFDSFDGEGSVIQESFFYIKKKNPKVIELGCGNGRDAIQIIKYTKNYLGIDASKKLIALAKEKLPKIQFRVGNFEDFPFPKDIDLVFAFASLLHTDKHSLKKIFHRVHSSLTKNGLFCFSLQEAPYQRKVITNNYGARTFYFYELKNVKELMDGNYKILRSHRTTFKNGHWLKIILQKKLTS